MSYILDALRKADAERERDPARGIHAQPAAGTPVRGTRTPGPWTWVAAGALVTLAAGYVAWGREEPAKVEAAVRRAPAVALAPVPAPVPPAAAVTAPVAQEPPLAAPAPVATSVSPPPPAPVERMVTSAVVAPRLAAAPQAAAVPVAVQVAQPAPTQVAQPAPTQVATQPAVLAAPATVLKAPPPVVDRILALAELPPDVQKDLPKLAISGGVHSDNAAQRMLIVGGQVMTEGQELAPGLVLEQIRARSAVLRFRGLRYSVSY